MGYEEGSWSGTQDAECWVGYLDAPQLWTTSVSLSERA